MKYDEYERSLNLWKEFRFWYKRYANVKPQNVLFYKRRIVRELLEDRACCILDEPNFLLVRVRFKTLPDRDMTIHEFHTFFKGLTDSPFSSLTVEDWDPLVDAKNRIKGALERARNLNTMVLGDAGPNSFGPKFKDQAWKVRGQLTDGTWLILPEGIERKSKQFQIFIGEVLGDFTKSYLNNMPDTVVDDPWLISLFIHLLLDSISIWRDKEKMAREFPYV